MDSVTTEDGVVVVPGDCVFNYYDGWWGVVGEIADNGWFPCVGLAGEYAVLDGSRVAVSLPTTNPLYEKYDENAPIAWMFTVQRYGIVEANRRFPAKD